MRFRSLLLAAVAVIATSVLAVQGQVPGVNSTLNSVFTLAYDQSTMKPTYSASIGQFTLPAAASDVCMLYGSATKTLKVRRVIVGGLATAVQTDPVAFVKRSSVSTGGVGTVFVNTAYDSNSPASTAVAEAYTTIPTTTGALVGLLADVYVTFGNLTTGVGSTYSYTVGALGSPVVLRGILESLTVNLGGMSVAGGVFSCTFEWTED